MDDKGFIFTGDATLALVVVIVITASIVAYAALPIFQGQSHEHLEALADSVLETMEQSGQLRDAAVVYSSNNTAAKNDTNAELKDTLDQMIPSYVGYKLTIGSTTITNRDNNSIRKDVATKVKVISGPEEGWVGRAYYKQEEVKFVDQNQTQVTTVWNFHNWLQNFYPWNSGWNSGLDRYPYWAGGRSPTPISFSVPSNGTINGAKFLLGSSGGYYYQQGWYQYWKDSAYGANFVLNGNTANHNIASGDFTDLQYASPSTGEMYNYLGSISGSELLSGLNNFYINFDDVHSRQYMPWFSILANYTTSIKVPQGVLTNTTSFRDISGVGNPTNSLLYDLNTGQITSTPTRSISWNTLQSNDIDTGTPFVITGIPSGDSRGSAVATTCDVYLPTNTRLFDAYTVVNGFGGCDRAIVQVKNSYGTWQTVFTSWDYTQRTDGGYGNIPGILNIAPYLTAGHNTVRIILWDNAPGDDYDLVGLTDCYSTITYSQLPIKWDTFPFTSKQYSSNTGTGTQTFNIANEAQEALLFVGTGTDSRSIKVTCQKDSSTSTLYDGPIPYVLNLGDLDAAASKHIITKVNSNGSYDLVPGSYSLTVSVTPGYSYESGDFGGSGTSVQTYANPEIFSGTRISVIYPKFLQNSWSSGFANTAEEAKENARQNLINTLLSYGISINPSLIKTEAIYTGDTPNSIPVRLDLWQE
jgi:hypothetical protein